jgi:chromosome partitioning protein
MKKIAIATMKGGSGKTTICFNIACLLAKRGYKVLCIDCDPQCNLSANFNLDVYGENNFTVCEIFDAPDTDPFDLVVSAPIKDLPTLDVIPSNMYLEGSLQQLSLKPMREQFMSKYMDKNAEFFNFYDYVFFDTNPSMNISNQNVLFACDSIVMVSDPGKNSVMGADIFLILWDTIRSYTGCEQKVDAFIVNNVEHTNASGDFLEFVEQHEVFRRIALEQIIPHLTCFKDSIDRYHLPVFMIPGKQRYSIGVKQASAALNNIVDQLLEGGVL